MNGAALLGAAAIVAGGWLALFLLDWGLPNLLIAAGTRLVREGQRIQARRDDLARDQAAEWARTQRSQRNTEKLRAVALPEMREAGK